MAPLSEDGGREGVRSKGVSTSEESETGLKAGRAGTSPTSKEGGQQNFNLALNKRKLLDQSHILYLPLKYDSKSYEPPLIC